MNQNNYKNQVVQICSDYAGISHIGQFRKDGKTPYITHPGRVASLTATFTKGVEDWYVWVAAAWLHDVIEDCSVIFNGDYSYEINNHNNFIDTFLSENDVIKFDDGIKIFEATVALTMSQNKSISKKKKKEAYYEGICEANPWVSVIKYCDRIDNLITAHIFS